MKIIAAYYFFLGFIYVWIANVIAKEDVSVSRGVVILLLTGVVGLAFHYLIGKDLGDYSSLALLPVNFGALIMLTHWITGIRLKQSAIIASIFTVLIFLFGLALTTCIRAAS